MCKFLKGEKGGTPPIKIFVTLIRTTCVIERLNKEFKRRTNPMEIVAAQNACYGLLAFMALQMELSRRTTPVDKARPNLPFYGIHGK